MIRAISGFFVPLLCRGPLQDLILHWPCEDLNYDATAKRERCYLALDGDNVA
jgi:hypothetical protein